MDTLQKLAHHFETQFASQPSQVFFAPGRVNLIGEHTDYNGGKVFPCALDIGTYAAIRPRTDAIVRCHSVNFSQTGNIEFRLDALVNQAEHDWANYPKGVIQTLKQVGYPLTHGADILFYGTLPHGAGLSSSASIEVLMATIIKHLEHYDDLSMTQIARYCQQAENQFIGVACGIMDQFSIAMGRQQHALLLDCNSLEFQYVPLQLHDYQLVIANTNKPRGLADSKYNERRAECEQALQLLQQQWPQLKHLCHLKLDEFEAAQGLIADPVLRQRARHAISENQRALAAFQALQQQDLLQFGQLMNQSHQSLRDDYAVTGHELDSLVSAAWRHPGCIGARMTGAGFGGCSINLVAKNQVDDFMQRVKQDYAAATGLEAAFYPANISDGAAAISL